MKIFENVSIKTYNTFGVDVKTRQLVVVNSAGEVRDIIDKIYKTDHSLIIGSGSNLLFTSDFDGIVVVNQLKGIEIIHETNEEVLIKVQGGENWEELVDTTMENNWYGLENLSLIPGTVGAAPVQNIGAYGVELKEVLVALEALEIETGESHQFANADCEFSYRYSIFKGEQKGRFFITSVVFKLSKKPILNLSYAPLNDAFKGIERTSISAKDVSEAVKAIRRSKLPDPEVIGNAGSFFKNPVVQLSKVEELRKSYPNLPSYRVDEQQVKIAAGWLIEQCGWKGKRIGDAGVHEKQALVLVNYGQASGKDIFNLSQEIKQSVYNQFGVELETEVTIL